MKRALIVGIAVLLSSAVGLVYSDQKGKKGPAREKAKPPVRVEKVVWPPEAKDESLPAKLASKVSFNGFDDPKFTLQDALEALSMQFGLRSQLNQIAFRAAGYQDKSVLQEPIAATPIPKMDQVRLDTVIKAILERIPTPPGKEAVYLIRDDAIRITTADFLLNEVWGGNYRGPYFPLVHPSFKEKQLDAALKELAEASGHNILVDKRRLGPKAEVPVTLQMVNAPLDTVVRLLADMSELDTVFLDNVIYVTTKENAADWNAKLRKEQQERTGDENSPPRIGTTGPVPTAPGSTPPGA